MLTCVLDARQLRAGCSAACLIRPTDGTDRVLDATSVFLAHTNNAEPQPLGQTPNLACSPPISGNGAPLQTHGFLFVVAQRLWIAAMTRHRLALFFSRRFCRPKFGDVKEAIHPPHGVAVRIMKDHTAHYFCTAQCSQLPPSIRPESPQQSPSLAVQKKEPS